MALVDLSDDILEIVLKQLPSAQLCKSISAVHSRLRNVATSVVNADADLYVNVNLSDSSLLARRNPLPYLRVIVSQRNRNGVSLDPSADVLDAIAQGKWARWFRKDIVSLSLYPTDEFQQTSISPLLQDVVHFPQLERLDLSGLWVDCVLDSLKLLPHLRDLILRGSSITQEELSKMSGLPQLKLLDLSFLQVYDRECGELLSRSEPLASAPKDIEVLVLHDFTLRRKLGDNKFATFSSFDHLKVLNLRSMCYFAVCDFSFLRHLHMLEKLCLDTGGNGGDWNSMVDFALAVPQPNRLDHITLTKTGGDFHHAFTKERFPHLKTLNLKGSSLNIGPAYEELVELEELNISFCSVVNAHCLPLKSLKAINLRDCRYLSSMFMEVLGECHQVERILLDGNDSNATNLRKLHRLKRLRVLSVHSPWVGNLGLKAISFLQNVQFLSARHCNLSDLGLKYIEQLKELRFANLTGNSFSESAASSLSRMDNMKKVLIDSGPDSKACSPDVALRDLPASITAAFSVAEYGTYPRDILYPPHL